MPRKKEGRAARLAAMMEQDGTTTPDGEGDCSMTPSEVENGDGKDGIDDLETESHR